MRKVTYIEHSGFLVELDSCYLLFDYVKGEVPSLKNKPLYVFVSHVHADHYCAKIYDMFKDVKTTFILSDDIVCEDCDDLYKLSPYTMIQVDELFIRTLKSTDEGVAFIVRIGDCCIYHAGDLHWWHWEEENSIEENEQAKQMYLQEIQTLAKEDIDIAFVVLDPRQEDQFTYGLDAFLSTCHAQHVFPMHFWGDYDCSKRFKNRCDHDCSSLIEIHHSQEEFEV